ncbi:PDR/VanB family oxidoreductase [Allorhizobium taibaishanense]|uniref:Oxygenase n=1 Tax=Allorhizobium taibaishanense TaxID=887144 RepID=A0A1Q8ZYH9_9HYPH|nr:PDR/VanB family oxidoreductase [Allorhizobium taibaishanense]MBB4008166.1 vanillate O-demethylase ferredoxin subunit [Allorhizobium taibaishanense]OLP47161.1 oxygenase [Allorhizobium taibaishanense]
MRMNMDWRQAQVSSVEEIAQDVRKVEFNIEGLLPTFDPGSHTNVIVMIEGQRAVRTYTCIPAAPGRLAIAVKRHANSRGGSRFIWSLNPGDHVEMTVPENRFELSWRAGHYLLIAGGIGVTPIYGMAKTLAGSAQSLRMVYGANSLAAMPFRAELQDLLGDKLAVFPADQDMFIDLDAEIAVLPDDAELYVCGPIGMLNAVKEAWAKARRPVSRLRYEVFGDNGKFAETSFEVSVANRGVTVQVRPDQSLLDALIGAGVEMIYDCQRGECGLCAVKILELEHAVVDHRDVFFSEEEKHESRNMCSCVSRLTAGRAVIDVGYRL